MSNISASAATLHRETFAWIRAQQHYFRIDRDFVNDDDMSFALKSFTELVLYADRLGAIGAPLPELRGLLDFIESELPAFDWIGAVLHSPVSAASLGYVLSFCTRFGIAPPFALSTARRLFESGFIESIERVPFRDIEIAFAMLAAGAPLADVAARLARMTTGGAAPMTPQTTRMGMYSVTHTIFFAAEFGERQLEPMLGGALVDGFKRFTTLGTANALRGADLDLLGEWLISWFVLEMEPTPLAHTAMETLVRGRRVDGSRAAFTFDEERYAQLEPDAARAYAFKHAYHTTLVSGMCGALWSARARSAVAA